MITSQPLAERHDFLARCARCSQCKFVPTIKSQRHASACPSMDYGQFHAFSGGGQLIMGYGLLSGDVDCGEELERAVSSCTMCGNCDISCKVNFAETVEPLDSLYALRAKLVADGQSPAAHARMMENIRATGNPEGHPRVERGNWAQGLTLTARNGAPEVMLHIGSQLMHQFFKILKALLKITFKYFPYRIYITLIFFQRLVTLTRTFTVTYVIFQANLKLTAFYIGSTQVVVAGS